MCMQYGDYGNRKSNRGGFDCSHCLRIDILCHGDTTETGIIHVSEPDYAVSKDRQFYTYEDAVQMQRETRK
ncbi:MAG: hypothetical protein ACLUD0_07880 [Eubacterium ramulus]